MGRYELHDYNKKKLRQIRISDAEMDYLGNPNSAWMRKAMMNQRYVELVFEKIEREGITMEQYIDSLFIYPNGEPKPIKPEGKFKFLLYSFFADNRDDDYFRKA
ncbi:hypothetical protein [Paenibacillus vini]|uniref:Uncharacterized protein n=1 Tax=Paenibacillus vini TaxID=1476024 RepID=A0ABQ4M764_9BACL|nr:hypothetical protein [Paenibacillus vini]GIP51821.1 hypothetical protein J42TS3_08560 [Paenibacillus vini]